MTALAATAPAGHAADPITVILLLIAAAAGYAVSLYVRPIRSCPRCRGTRLTGTGRRTRGCGRCGGTGHIRRIGATAVHRLYWPPR
jgi:DnaJ-class molecular chaperone